MLTRLALLGLQDWTALSKVQRRFVWMQFIHPMLSGWRMLLAKMGLAFPAAFIILQFGGFNTRIVEGIAVFLLIWGIPELFDLCVLALQRRKLSSYIQNHRAQIEAAA